jgi:hypothetical protein
VAREVQQGRLVLANPAAQMAILPLTVALVAAVPTAAHRPQELIMATSQPGLLAAREILAVVLVLAAVLVVLVVLQQLEGEVEAAVGSQPQAHQQVETAALSATLQLGHRLSVARQPVLVAAVVAVVNSAPTPHHQ